MTAKTKTYEITKCECGHECPIEFARIDDDAIYTCPNCYIDEVNSRIKELLPSDEDIKSLLDKWTEQAEPIIINERKVITYGSYSDYELLDMIKYCFSQLTKGE